MASGSGSVTNAGSSVYTNDVVEALSSAADAILLRVSPLGDGAGNSVIDCGGDRFVIGVFETERSGVLGCSLDAAECVFVSGPFREEDSEGVVEAEGWSCSVHHDAHRKVEGGGTVGARGEPRCVWDSVRARGAGFGVLEELDHVRLSGEHLFF